MTDDEGRPGPAEAVEAYQRVEASIRSFEAQLRSGDHRSKVRALIPVFRSLRRLGKALQPAPAHQGARERLLEYFLQHPATVLDGDELLVVSGIQEYARRIRELRVEGGWSIASGVTMKEGREDMDAAETGNFAAMMPSQYVLLTTDQDTEAAGRWQVANEIRKGKGSVRDRIICFLRENVGRVVTAEELRYVARDKKDWAGRVRDLRVEDGWPISTRSNGRPDLGVGTFVLEAARQCPPEDRSVPDEARKAAFERDQYKCTNCGWARSRWLRSEPRHLELHRLAAPTDRSEPSEALNTLCSKCHLELHDTEE